MTSAAGATEPNQAVQDSSGGPREPKPHLSPVSHSASDSSRPHPSSVPGFEPVTRSMVRTRVFSYVLVGHSKFPRAPPQPAPLCSPGLGFCHPLCHECRRAWRPNLRASPSAFGGIMSWGRTDLGDLLCARCGCSSRAEAAMERHLCVPAGKWPEAAATEWSSGLAARRWLETPGNTTPSLHGALSAPGRGLLSLAPPWAWRSPHAPRLVNESCTAVRSP